MFGKNVKNCDVIFTLIVVIGKQHTFITQTHTWWTTNMRQSYTQSHTVCIIHNLSSTCRIIIRYWTLFVTY